MTKPQHPLTDEMCEKIQLHIFNQTDEDCMRSAADWQLQQVVEWLEGNLTRGAYLEPVGYSGHQIDVADLLSDIKKAMRSQHPMFPTQEQFAEWDSKYFDGERQNFTAGQVDVIMVEVFQAGADKQLKQVIEWLKDYPLWETYAYGTETLIDDLRKAMRPATKEQES